jgi:hypothetical protein
MQQQTRIQGSFFLALVLALTIAGTSTAARATSWVWTKKEAQWYVGGKSGVTTVCFGLGAPYRKQGLNYYYRFRCGLVFDDGTAFALIIKPVSATKYRTLSIKKVHGATGAGAGGLYPSTGSGHWITDTSDDASVVTLEDGSRWLTSPIDRYNAITWLITDNVTVVESSPDPSYPYLLVDTDDGSSVSARFLGY